MASDLDGKILPAAHRHGHCAADCTSFAHSALQSVRRSSMT
jgi:hypothetical protein